MLKVQQSDGSYVIRHTPARKGYTEEVGLPSDVAVELVKELWRHMSRLEREEVLVEVLPLGYCTKSAHLGMDDR